MNNRKEVIKAAAMKLKKPVKSPTINGKPNLIVIPGDPKKEAPKVEIEALKLKTKESSPAPILLSITDVANSLGKSPKAVRAKLRRLKGKAQDGRWAKVVPNSPEHQELLKLLKGD